MNNGEKKQFRENRHLCILKERKHLMKMYADFCRIIRELDCSTFFINSICISKTVFSVIVMFRKFKYLKFLKQMQC